MKIKTNPRKSFAFSYLKRGWSIIPIGKKKIPFVKWGKFQKQKPTKEEILQWVKEWPKLNWAVVTGAISNIVVLDIDPRNGGAESLKELEKQYGPLPHTAKVRTGGGGTHFYFKYPGFFVKCRSIRDGVEIKGDQGTCTLPPSIHASGEKYEWEIRPDQKLAEMPAWLITLLKASANDPVATSTAVGGSVSKEGRNVTLARLAGSLRRLGLNESTIFKVLRKSNPIIFPETPPGKNEVRSISKSVGKYPTEFHSAAPIPISAAETNWMTAKDLAESPDIILDWIWHGFIGLGMVSLLTAKPKVGKSTLLFQLFEAIAKGKEFLGFQTKSNGKILLFTEEPKTLLKRRIKKLGLAQDDFYGTLISAYKEFEDRVGHLKTARGAKGEMVRQAIERLPDEFTAKELRHACPGVSPDMIRVVLRELQKEKRLTCAGHGPAAVWRRKGNIPK